MDKNINKYVEVLKYKLIFVIRQWIISFFL